MLSNDNQLTIFRNVCILFFLLYFVKGCQIIPDQLPIEKNGKIYGVTKGLFQHNSWDYYERGLSFAKGGFWNEAAIDLQKAISLNYKDQWNARTYGWRFIDYFPHRELGIAKYYLGKYKESIEELVTSRDMVKTAKTEMYIDRVRKKIIEQKTGDSQRPKIFITSPDKYFVTNDFFVTIHGLAIDNHFVSSIKVKDNNIRIDISEKEIPFHVKCPIDSGEDEIPITVTDLFGNTSKTFINFRVDRLGPVISIDEHSKNNISQTKFVLKAAIFDESGLKELIINKKKKILCNESKMFNLKKIVLLQPGTKEIHLEAIDSLGNSTDATINCIDKKQNSIKSELLAFNNTVYENGILTGIIKKKRNLAEKENPDIPQPPKLNLRYPTEKIIKTYLNQFYVCGNIEDRDSKVEALSINGTNVDIPLPGKKVFFKEKVSLTKDTNFINFRFTDSLGYAGSETITIIKLIPKIYNEENRLKLFIKTFPRHPNDNILSDDFEEHLLDSLAKKIKLNNISLWRFSVKQDIVSKSTIKDAAVFAKQNKFDCFATGNIRENYYDAEDQIENSIEIQVKVFDTQEKRLSHVNAYKENINKNLIADNLKNLAQELYEKIVDDLPIIEGTGTIVDDDEIKLDIGETEKLKENMQLIIYKKQESSNEQRPEEKDQQNPNEQKPQDNTNELELARVKSVDINDSTAYFIDHKKRTKKQKIKFITR